MSWSSNEKNKKGNWGGLRSSSSDIDRTLSNYQTRLLKAGESVPVYKDKSTFSTLGKDTLKLLSNLDRFRSGTMNALHYAATDKNALQGFEKGFTQKEDYTGSDVMNALNVKNKAARFAGGVATEMLFDPLSYTTLGLGSLGKGLITGKKATLSAEALNTASRAADTTALRKAEKSLLEQNRAFNLPQLQEKLGTGKIGVQSAIKKEAYNAEGLNPTALRKARLEFEQASRQKAQQAAETKAGKGFSVGGKTVFKGSTLQDLGASTRNIPVIGTALKAVDNTVGNAASKLFSTTGTLTGLDTGQRAIYKSMRNTQGGRNALQDVMTGEAGIALAKLQKGVTVGERSIDEAIPDFIATGGAADRQYLDQVITTSPEKKMAWATLQRMSKVAPADFKPNATFQDLTEYYMKQLKRIGINEEKAGVLSRVVDKSKSTSIDDDMDFSNYFPRVMSRDLSTNMRKGGMTRNLNINNTFANRRNPEYEGKSIGEINKIIRDKYVALGAEVPENFKFFETSALNALMTRALSSNKVLADKDFADTLLNTFGNRVQNKSDIKRWMDEGYDIVVPKAKLNVFKADKDLRTAGVMGDKVDGDAAVTMQKIVEAKEALKSLSYNDAVSFVGTADMPRLYAMPAGIAAEVNARSAKQIDDGVKAFKDIMNRFNSKWKPLVTGLRPAYHARNLASSSFNNILDIGSAIADPQVQAAALAVAGDAVRNYVGKRGTGTFKIAGKEYTADSLKKLMIENNALNTFMLTDADTLAHGMADDVARKASSKVSGWDRATALGRATGNRTEEYVRATNFIAHLKMGETAEQAAESVRKVHFDYQDITSFEQNIKLVMPFYTWLRKNLPLQMESILNNPSAYLALDRMGKTGAEESGFDYSSLPDYIRENMAVPVGTTEDGKQRVLDAGLPVSDLYTGGKDVLSMLSPVLKVPLELGINKNIMTGQPIHGYDEEVPVNFLKGDSPVARAISKSPYLSQLMLNHPQASTAALYGAKNFSGVMGDVNKYVAPVDSQGVVATHAQRNQTGGVAGLAERMVDPNMLKYVDQDKAITNKKYAYSRQLANTIQYLKDMGINVQTMNEIKKSR